MMTLFVSSARRIDLIQMQQDTKGNDFFQRREGLYVMDENIVVPYDHQISIGSGR